MGSASLKIREMCELYIKFMASPLQAVTRFSHLTHFRHEMKILHCLHISIEERYVKYQIHHLKLERETIHAQRGEVSDAKNTSVMCSNYFVICPI